MHILHQPSPSFLLEPTFIGNTLLIDCSYSSVVHDSCCRNTYNLAVQLTQNVDGPCLACSSSFLSPFPRYKRVPLPSRLQPRTSGHLHSTLTHNREELLRANDGHLSPRSLSNLLRASLRPHLCSFRRPIRDCLGTRPTQGALYDGTTSRLEFDVGVPSGDESCFERQHQPPHISKRSKGVAFIGRNQSS
ncbi:uncharacterized protein BT62DRAFT_39060 [Guyanagaster necrorhizus]|uniref:Uncharacterized protein n=1 Tax=Guyanagaster necrorhizus TaxID=856835 RepID=A0A9P7W666_9AGAR|nr:uncharacterized protein BT62DRAFT_39060 [Guyanagaster necrorhizus MCA 3950]KAG7452969.1 hypothetical protein BT62DRAFT_39060 [Guyanagaster necrorhizus MCA 3950]